MNAKKCDRCGQFYEEREPNVFENLAKAIKNITTITKKTELIIQNDLCVNCKISAKEWWEGATDERAD